MEISPEEFAERHRPHAEKPDALKKQMALEIREFRQRLDPEMPQHQLASLLGVPTSTVSRWEKGDAVPRLHHIIKLYNLGMREGKLPNLLHFLNEGLWFFIDLDPSHHTFYARIVLHDRKGVLRDLLTNIWDEGGGIRRMDKIKEGEELDVRIIIDVLGGESMSEEEILACRKRMKTTIVDRLSPLEADCWPISRMLQTLYMEREMARMRSPDR